MQRAKREGEERRERKRDFLMVVTVSQVRIDDSLPVHVPERERQDQTD